MKHSDEAVPSGLPAAGKQDAAASLKRHLFGHVSTLEADGFIGLGTDVLHVYVSGSRRAWKQQHMTEWQGWPLHWHYNVGPVIALNGLLNSERSDERGAPNPTIQTDAAERNRRRGGEGE